MSIEGRRSPVRGHEITKHPKFGWTEARDDNDDDDNNDDEVKYCKNYRLCDHRLEAIINYFSPTKKNETSIWLRVMFTRHLSMIEWAIWYLEPDY